MLSAFEFVLSYTTIFIYFSRYIFIFMDNRYHIGITLVSPQRISLDSFPSPMDTLKICFFAIFILYCSEMVWVFISKIYFYFIYKAKPLSISDNFFVAFFVAFPSLFWRRIILTYTFLLFKVIVLWINITFLNFLIMNFQKQ